MKLCPFTVHLTFTCLAATVLPCFAVVDQNNNQLSDIWELIHETAGLAAQADTDGDGWTNSQEHAAGTDPREVWSFPSLSLTTPAVGSLALAYAAQEGKRYTILSSPDLGNWQPGSPSVAQSTGTALVPLTSATRAFFRLEVGDVDMDADGISDWEERQVGFNPAITRSERLPTLDSTRVPAMLTATNFLSVGVYDPTTAERWPEPAVITIRRTGGLQPLTVSLAVSGTADLTTDYQFLPALGVGNTVKFAAGQREVFLEILPVVDAVAELEETVALTLAAAPVGALAYTIMPAASTSTVAIEADGTNPTAKEAARFLVQAGFGPSQDASDDADIIPENVEAVMLLGFDAWLEDQFTRPVGLLQPFVDWALPNQNVLEIYNDKKMDAWWNRAMGVSKLRPDATATQAADPLRQRMGFALSQIFVISDRMEDIGTDPSGMAHYYDRLLTHSFGSFRALLEEVSLHPCMGMYLSHCGNQKPDPEANRFPDENYAREIMQLFTIGLWELNADGTRKLNGQGQPIPTYGNGDITELARVFTGISFGQPEKANFGIWPRDFHFPMAGWDAEHDLQPKRLVDGSLTPARTASSGRTGTATLADIDAALDVLSAHGNVGPFMGRLLIQRFVTSNPSAAYLGRVSAVFANNGQGARGDLKAMLKAILLDPEARSYAATTSPTHGKLREPFLKCVNLATAFNASAPAGWFYLDAFSLDHAQEPMKAPSVFNYYLPNYTPPGALAQAGLVAPEFQIINATTATMAPNYFWNSITGGLHRWGVGRADYNATLNLVPEMALNAPSHDPGTNQPAYDPDALLRRLDLALTGGTTQPKTLQNIREALVRIGPGSTWDWPMQRLKFAVYGIVTSPEFGVLR